MDVIPDRTPIVWELTPNRRMADIKQALPVWEQRYSIVNPKRTKTNIRYYEDDDLKLLLNIALLNKNGIKISKIAKMDKAEIAEKVSAISEINFENATQLDALTISMIEMDEYKFDRIVSTNIQQLGFERTMLEVIYPFLEKLSVLWLTGSINPAQENFMSYLIRQQIIVAIDKEPLATGRHAKKFVIYLPEGEKQELSMLFMHYLVKSRRHKVIYIGQEMSLTDLKDTYDIHQPDYIFTMISETFTKEPVQAYVDKMSETLPESEILLSGYQVVTQDVKPGKNVTILKSLQQMITFLDQLNPVVQNGHAKH